MALLFAIPLILYFLALILQGYVGSILARYSEPRPDFPGTGGDLAKHLLERAGISNVTVEITDMGDHYDPIDKRVGLTRDKYNGVSLTAVVVAAHEVGHAIQDHYGYSLLHQRTNWVLVDQEFMRWGRYGIYAMLIAALLMRSPAALYVAFGIGLGGYLISIIIHFITLPMEWDASFGRAMPILEKGGYLNKKDIPAARRILKACALTYVAGALMSLFSFNRWLYPVGRR